MPEIQGHPRSLQNGRVHHGQNVHQVRFAPNTFYDKGLFDARELGYIY